MAKPATKTPKTEMADGVAAAPVAAGSEAGDAVANQLRIKTLVDHVTAKVGGKPKEMRDAVLATLAEIGAALERGEAMNLPELGRIRINRRTDDADGGATFVLKVKRGGLVKAKGEKEPLAEGAE